MSNVNDVNEPFEISWTFLPFCCSRLLPLLSAIDCEPTHKTDVLFVREGSLPVPQNLGMLVTSGYHHLGFKFNSRTVTGHMGHQRSKRITSDSM